MASPPAPIAADARGREATVPPTPPLQSALLIIAGLLLFAAFVIVMLRRLLRRSASSEAEAAGAAGTEQVDAEAGPEMAIAAALWEPEPEAEAEEEAEGAGDAMELLLAWLPMFTLESALAALPKNSPDCAVCLSPFDPGDGLRLLPACRHAFHAACVDVWLRTNPVCPICRGAVTVPLPALPADADNPAADAGAGREAVVPRARRGRSRSRRYRVELGSVSHRRSFPAPVDDRRIYSLGGSFHYRVEEEVEAAIVVRPAAAAARPSPATAAPSQEALAGVVAPRGWLREYADRAAASASSLSLSGRLSQQGLRSHNDSARWDPEAAAAVAKSAATTPEATRATSTPASNEALAPDSRGRLLGESYLDRLAASAPSLSGRWSHQQCLRRDVSSQWDTEAACSAPREEEPALVALVRWIFGM